MEEIGYDSRGIVMLGNAAVMHFGLKTSFCLSILGMIVSLMAC